MLFGIKIKPNLVRGEVCQSTRLYHVISTTLFLVMMSGCRFNYTTLPMCRSILCNQARHLARKVGMVSIIIQTRARSLREAMYMK